MGSHFKGTHGNSAGDNRFSFRKQREIETMNLDVSLPFSLLFRPGPYACGNKLATFKLRLHASVNPSHKLCQRFVS